MKQDFRQKYTHFLKQCQHSIFHQPWWLDATCGKEGWGAVFVEKGENTVAALPFSQKKGRYGQTVLGQPPFTPFLGPIYLPSNARYSRRLGYEHTLFERLIQKLPPYHHFYQTFHHTITNWLPFRWNGFQQSTQYTYKLYNIKNHLALWNETDDNIRTDVRKAQTRFSLHIEQIDDIELFLKVYAGTWMRQKKDIPNISIIRSIDTACTTQNCRRILFAADKLGRYHAATYTVWDHSTAYYLMGGSNPHLRQSGAHSFLLWETIIRASENVDIFDFEGSNIRPIEKNFRSFGGRQTPLLHLERATPMFGKIMLIRKLFTDSWK